MIENSINIQGGEISGVPQYKLTLKNKLAGNY